MIFNMKKISIYKILFILLLGLFLFPVRGDIVSKIEFEGLDRVEQSVLEDSVTIKPGIEFTHLDIDNTLKKLFNKDFFSDIKFVRKGNILVIECTEKPMVDKVAFEGNDSASDDALKSVINNRIGSGRLFSTYIIKDILSDFQMLYRALGYCSARVTPKIIKHPGNRIDVVFEIVEGEKTTIKKIILVGNKSFTDDDLKDLMSLKEEKLWRFWNYDSHIFREDKLETDIETITSFYKNRGYPFFMVTSTSAEMSFDKRSHYCTLIMEEGDKYTINDVILKSEVEKVNADNFKAYIPIKKGNIFSEGLINFTKDGLRRVIALNDHPFVDVVVDVSFDKQEKTATVNYKIIEKEKTFIDRIEIYGNTKTLDKVIRRDLSVHDGDALNTHKVHDSIERLKGIGYFDDVEVAEEEGSIDDRKVLKITVKEKESTAQIRFGLNASTVDGFGGMLEFSENNLIGTGRRFSAETFCMQKYYGCQIDLYDPRFMDQNFGAGMQIGFGSHNRKNVDQSISKSMFLAPYIRYSITKNLYHSLKLTISSYNRKWWSGDGNKTYSNVPDEYKGRVLMEEEYGKYSSGELSSTLTYDRTDNSYEPRNGYELSIVNACAGVVGNVKYFRNEFGLKYYRPISEKVTFIADMNLGHIHEGSGTRSYHRFALGGDGQNMRGFDIGGVGPHDLRENSVGGNKYWTASFMAKAPLSTREVGINGVVFLDLGSAWGSKYAKDKIRDSSSIRASVGFAVEWARCPLGVPMAFIFGFPIKKKSFDEKRTFTLSGFM